METRRPNGILQKLEENGFEAYFVGGCVRDTLLGRTIHDWDVTTSAQPQQVMALFPHSIPTGLRHGTVTVISGAEQAEVTTFRADGAYCDGRHPAQVAFVATLREDLARRDFTVNAMAMDLRGKIYDCFGGQEDLRAGILRCVGEPTLRFREDALRMLRAYRFAAQLGFSLESETERAIELCAEGCMQLSRERIREETEKTLLSPRPEYLEKMLKARLLRPCGLARTTDLGALAQTPCEPAVRWTALKLALPELMGEEFRLPARLCALITRAAANFLPQPDALRLKHIAAESGADTARVVAQLSGRAALWDEILSAGECIGLRQLAISGRDFPQLRGAEVGEMLNRLLLHVLEHPEDNNRQRLLAISASLMGSDIP